MGGDGNGGGGNGGPARRVTTVAYACLALLADGPLTASQIVSGMERLGIRLFWPRAASRVYEEPRRLCEQGFAQVVGPRASGRGTVYEITEEGRRALRGWLDQPGLPPSIEYEALLKVHCGDHGSTAQLLAQLEAVKDHVVRGFVRLMGIAATVGTEGPRNPGAARIRAMVFQYSAWDVTMRARWVIDAERYVRGWDGDEPDDGELAELRQWFLARSAELAVGLEQFGAGEGPQDTATLPSTPVRRSRR
jgi:PadR family transcriptional regulator AphA